MSRAPDPKSKVALLKAAEEVFAERGVAGAKVEDISRKAGLSKGAFYLHFESKEAALKQIVEGWFARCASFFASPTEYQEDSAPDPYALLDFCIERDVQLYSFLWQTRPTMRIIQSCRGEYEYLSEAFRDDIRRRNREWLVLWRQDGFIRPETNIDLAAIMMSGAYEELTVLMHRSEERPPLEDWLEFARETFVRAYGTPELVNALERRHRRTSANADKLSTMRRQSAGEAPARYSDVAPRPTLERAPASTGTRDKG